MIVRFSRIACISLIGLAVSACASGGGYGYDVETGRNVDGAVAGCLIGGILGALVDSGSPERGAAIGCAGGGVTGYAASEYVNDSNAQYADAQAVAYDREQEALAMSAYYRRNTEIVRSFVDDEARKIARLNAQYRAQQITAAEYQNQIASANENIESIYGQIQEIDVAVAQIDADIQQTGGSEALYQTREDLLAEREKLRQAAEELSRLYSRQVPREVRTGA